MVFTVKMDFSGLPGAARPGIARRVVKQSMAAGVAAASVAMRASFQEVTPTNRGLTRLGWQTLRVTTRGQQVQGGVAVTGEAGLTALVLEDRARPHFPPVPKDPGAEPALGVWLRRQRNFEPFVTEIVQGAKVKRKMNPGSLRDVRRAAFAISRKINIRGLPRAGRTTRIYAGALERISPVIDGILSRARDNAIAKLAQL